MTTVTASAPEGPTVTQAVKAEGAVFGMMILLAVIYVLVKRYTRRAFPRTAAGFRAVSRWLSPPAARPSEEAGSRYPWLARHRESAVLLPMRVPRNWRAFPADPLARPAGCAPWDRLTREQAEVWFAAQLASEPEPWFSAAATGGFPAVAADPDDLWGPSMGHADIMTMEAVR